MQKVELPILYITEKGIELQEMNIDSEEEKKVHMVTFFKVDAVGPSVDKFGNSISKESVIFVAGDSFVCTLSKEEVLIKLGFKNNSGTI